MSKTFGPEKYGLLPPRCSRGLKESASAVAAKAAIAVVYLTMLQSALSSQRAGAGKAIDGEVGLAKFDLEKTH